MKRIAGMILLSLLFSATVWAAEPAARQAKKPGPLPPQRVSVDLFNGTDFEGWKRFIPDTNVDPDTVWQVKDGVIHCTGTPNGYIRTTKPYKNYRLIVQWRWPDKGGNSGVLLHVQEGDKVWPKSIEAQLKSGDAGDFWVIDGTDFKQHTDKSNRRVKKLKASTEKPVGEWNEMRVECRADTIRVWVNGVLQNFATGTTVKEGYIALQSEGTPIEFRSIRLYPLAERRAGRHLHVRK